MICAKVLCNFSAPLLARGPSSSRMGSRERGKCQVVERSRGLPNRNLPLHRRRIHGGHANLTRSSRSFAPDRTARLFDPFPPQRPRKFFSGGPLLSLQGLATLILFLSKI